MSKQPHLATHRDNFLTTPSRFRRPRLRLLCTGRYCDVFCLLVILHKKLEHLKYLTPMKSCICNTPSRVRTVQTPLFEVRGVRFTLTPRAYTSVIYTICVITSPCKRGLSLDACSACYFDSTH